MWKGMAMGDIARCYQLGPFSSTQAGMAFRSGMVWKIWPVPPHLLLSLLVLLCFYCEIAIGYHLHCGKIVWLTFTMKCGLAAYQLDIGYLSAGYRLTSSYPAAILQLAISYLSVGYWLDTSWISAGYRLATSWLLDGYYQLLAGYRLANSWPWAGYLLSGYGLVICYLALSNRLPWAYHELAIYQLAIHLISVDNWLDIDWILVVIRAI